MQAEITNGHHKQTGCTGSPGMGREALGAVQDLPHRSAQAFDGRLDGPQQASEVSC